MHQPARILVVDDVAHERELLAFALDEEGHDIVEAEDGQQAWEQLQEEPEAVDVVLLDRIMPRMTGLELLRRMKAHPILKTIPVVVLSGRTGREEILEGIEAGAYYYLTKPLDPTMVLSIVRTAVGDSREYQSLREEVRKSMGSLGLMQVGQFELRTLDEARDLAALLANTCPDPERVVIGLTELVVNALEHGNLGISYQQKSVLKERGEWVQEVTRRLALAGNAHKRVRVAYRRDENEIAFEIKDEGSGFDWRPFLQIDPSRAGHSHGRGIAMANLLSFDRLEYRGSGCEVVAIVDL